MTGFSRGTWNRGGTGVGSGATATGRETDDGERDEIADAGAAGTRTGGARDCERGCGRADTAVREGRARLQSDREARLHDVLRDEARARQEGDAWSSSLHP